MARLTLSVDSRLVERAKRVAKQQGVSVSKIVETYLAALTSAPAPPPQQRTPILNSLRGSLKRADLSDYRRHLERKYPIQHLKKRGNPHR